ncbi:MULTISPECIES: type IV pilus modification protein PilV [unclassified Pseudomonas]|uniref:type IV pilus modification protein PilV n=2 Tax=Pseudomonas TaxID=286 RepID=UPI002AC9C1F0|nr:MULTISPECIES: type IV pilus modification protein PilV [unclassified Pseudomonas]MEB0042448.1 type IV pilus modification protein PilV [Pseudomonas sp. MH10]MEB0090973.1 type IV pilus modification protein PilV [Pseudomonas sp. CCI4.2]MEB0121872.1 type IV pilus modification protein PilV [Pseudomonas sp. CCI1.2]WPX55865.1 type IV pilus modification protein PilV [Pseudomonas sp. CCI4.2]
MQLITGIPTKSSGFSMIEVLVSLLVIVVGVLGMVGLQSKAIPYTQDSAQRNTAIMLADDLLELIRSNPNCGTIGSCQKLPGASFPTVPSACIPTPISFNDQVGCWAVQAGNALPGASALLKTGFYVCNSATPGDVTASSCGTGSEIEIQLSWTVKTAGDCMDPSNSSTTCTYKIRTRR